MSPGQTNGLLATFVALVFIATLALMFSRWPAWLKALLVMGVTALYFQSERVLGNIWGWPSPTAMPARFVLIGAEIVEPSSKDKGALYLWVHPMEGNKPSAVPRAYQLPYTKDLHSLLNEATKKQRQGVSQLGSSTPRGGPQGFSWLRGGSDEVDVKIRDMPVPQLPEK